MSSYIPEYVLILNPCPSYVAPNPSPANPELLDSIPATPKIVSVPLPSSTLTTSSQSTDLDFYPIRILSHLPSSKKIRLQETVLTSPIHVHTPYAHIGTIHTSFPGQRVNSLDLMLGLKSLAQFPLSFHGTYIHLGHQMKYEVQAAFYHRCGQSLSVQTDIIWEEFTSGGVTLNGPLGEDLFLGNTYVWGLEQKSNYDYSIVHLA